MRTDISMATGIPAKAGYRERPDRRRPALRTHMIVFLLVLSQMMIGVPCCAFADSHYALADSGKIPSIEGHHAGGDGRPRHDMPADGAFDHCTVWTDNYPFLMPQFALPVAGVDQPVWQAQVLALSAPPPLSDPPALHPPPGGPAFQPPLYRLYARLLL